MREDKYVFPGKRKYTVAGGWNMYSQAVTSIQWSGRTWAWITPNNPWPCPLLTLTAQHIQCWRRFQYSTHSSWAEQCIYCTRDNRFWIWDSHLNLRFTFCLMHVRTLPDALHASAPVCTLNCCHWLRYSTRRSKAESSIAYCTRFFGKETILHRMILHV